MNQLIPIKPFEAEYAARDSDHKQVWMPCTVVGVKDGNHRYEFIVLCPFDDDMMCVMSLDDVRIRAADKPADAPSD